jgi:NAD(P)-dependent dehydrogenase (short-subunit alcohol dehydrogenase family)
MTRISSEDLLQHAARARGRVVVITGGAAGPGRDAAFLFASKGADVVIGDIYMHGAHTIVDAIKKLPPGSGAAHSKRCDVTKWEDQVSLFEHAITTFGRIDIVIVGARVGEIRNFGTPQLLDGKPVKPQLKTLDVNLIGAMYTTQLALHYLPKSPHVSEPLRYVVLLGFLASWDAHPNQEVFVTSQHGLLGFARSTQPVLFLKGIRIAIVQTTSPPGTGGDTDSTIRRTAQAMFFCATNPDPNANGSVWALMQNGSIQRMEEAQEVGSLGAPPAYTI